MIDVLFKELLLPIQPADITAVSGLQEGVYPSLVVDLIGTEPRHLRGSDIRAEVGVVNVRIYTKSIGEQYEYKDKLIDALHGYVGPCVTYAGNTYHIADLKYEGFELEPGYDDNTYLGICEFKITVQNDK